jgi:hypothetical protein
MDSPCLDRVLTGELSQEEITYSFGLFYVLKVFFKKLKLFIYLKLIFF